MRKFLGILFMLLGAVLVTGAMLLFLSNRQEDLEAGEISNVMLTQIQEEILNDQPQNATEEYLDNVPVELLDPEDLVMTEKDVNGYSCIGYIEIPELNLQLPVISDWSYPKLKVSPCRYYGSARGEDLVIMAHSYKTHFGRISTLTEGSIVRFVDMDGKVWEYQVVVKPFPVLFNHYGLKKMGLSGCSILGDGSISLIIDAATLIANNKK